MTPINQAFSETSLSASRVHKSHSAQHPTAAPEKLSTH